MRDGLGGVTLEVSALGEPLSNMASTGRGRKTFPPPAERGAGTSSRGDMLEEDDPFDRPTMIPDQPPEELAAQLEQANEDSAVLKRTRPPAGLGDIELAVSPPTRRYAGFDAPAPRSTLPTIVEEDPLAFDMAVVARSRPAGPRSTPPVTDDIDEAWDEGIFPKPTGEPVPAFRQNARTQPEAASRAREERRGPFPTARERRQQSESPTIPPPSETEEGSALNLVAARGAAAERNVPSPPPPRAPVDSVTDMRDRFALGDFSGALVVAESIIEGDPSHAEAGRCAESCRDRLRQMYASRLGSLSRVPRVIVPPDQVRWLSLDHRSGFILSCVDGYSTIEEILDVSGMPALDALRVLYELLQQRIIAVG